MLKTRVEFMDGTVRETETDHRMIVGWAKRGQFGYGQAMSIYWLSPVSKTPTLIWEKEAPAE